MVSTAAVGGSFEVSPAAASTHIAETTPGGASGADDTWEEASDGEKAPEETSERKVEAEATLAAPEIQVKAPPEDETQGDVTPQVQRAPSGLSDKPKAAAAVATKKASRFTFMGMGRKK